PTSIDLTGSDVAIDGLGLGKTQISVRQKASNGLPLEASSAVHVSLKTTAGALVPPGVDIVAHRSDAETTLVSSAWGTATVTVATDSSAVSRSVTVNFAFPWLKVLLGLFGALLAGLIRILRAAPGEDSRAQILLACAVSGIVADILLALGVPIAPVAVD